MVRNHFELSQFLNTRPTLTDIYLHITPLVIGIQDIPHFWLNTPKFCIFHYWGCVRPHIWQASWPLASRHIITWHCLSWYLIYKPSHIGHSWVMPFQVWIWTHVMLCHRFIIWQIIRNVSISYNDHAFSIFVWFQWPLLLIWFEFNPSMDK